MADRVPTTMIMMPLVCDVDHSKDSIRLIIGARGKEECVLAGATLAVAKRNSPQAFGVRAVNAAIQNQRIAAGVGKLSEEAAGFEVECADVAVSEVADQQIAAELRETSWGNGHSDRRV